MVGSAVEYDGENKGNGDGVPISEFVPESIVVTGSATVPAPLVLTSAPSDWAPYDGVLITLQGVEVTESDAGYGEAETDFGINIDDYFVDFATTTGTFYDATGLLNQYYGWKLAPRSQDDLVEK
jgi:hypothetical protein